jgi:DNA-binding SARP family transcriptional activator
MLTIRLLGKPALERDGRPERPPRGRKSWALLAYVVLESRCPSRRQLASMLFGDADDPLGALRWTLAELRRCLGEGISLEGDPVRCTVRPDTVIDVRVLSAGDDPAGLLDLTGELLEGLDIAGNEIFDSWLVVERHRLAALLEARLRQAAVSLLATGRATTAVPFAARVVEMNALDEANHELLARALALSGDQTAALRQVTVAEDLIRRELGISPSPALREAALIGEHSAMTAPVSGRAAALSEMDAGRAALAAGAVDAGLQCLRRAVNEAEACGDLALKGQALNALGGALVHAARGRDEEGSILLREAVEIATQVGDDRTAVVAFRELGYIDVQAGRRRTAEEWLAKADTVADTDEDLAAISGVRGMNDSDRADYPAAFDHLRSSVEHAERAGDRRQQAWSLSLIGRAHMLRGERSQATAALLRSVELVEQERWLAFLPWPQTLLAELNLRAGDGQASDALERAWYLACQLNDACWESMAARGLGLLATARGERAAADQWLAEAAARSTRLSDRYQWVHGHVLDTLITVLLDRGDAAQAAPIVDSLARLAARCEMPELTVRAYMHRHRAGDRTALQSAQLLARSIDNPALSNLLHAAPARL